LSASTALALDTERRRQAHDRKQRWRERQRTGRFVVAIELSGDLLDKLTGAGWLTDGQTFDRNILAAEIPALLDLLCRRRKL